MTNETDNDEKHLEFDEQEIKYADSDDDYYDEEVIVNTNGDCRKLVYESIIANESIIKCIGQLVMIYKYDDKKRDYKVTIKGTGTVYHVDKHKNAYIITCAHNIRHKIKECGGCGKWMEMKSNQCIRSTCYSNNFNEIIIKANGIQFNRRNVENDHWIKQDGKEKKIEYGFMEKGYKAKCFYINDDKYNQYTSTKDGFDIALLSFIDSDNYYAKYCKYIC
eukprot:308034_1